MNTFKLLARADDEAKIGFKVHPHMHQHACGYELAGSGIPRSSVHRAMRAVARAEAKKEVAIAELTTKLLGKKLSQSESTRRTAPTGEWNRREGVK